MIEHYKQTGTGDASQPESSDPVVLLKKIQQHLVFLEKKIDTLIGQSQAAPPQGNSFRRNRDNFSRPPRPPFGHPHGAGRERHSRHSESSGGGAPRHDRPSFGGPPRKGGEGGFFRKKKPFFGRHKG